MVRAMRRPRVGACHNTMQCGDNRLGPLITSKVRSSPVEERREASPSNHRLRDCSLVLVSLYLLFKLLYKAKAYD